jgi:hypothetical protein
LRVVILAKSEVTLQAKSTTNQVDYPSKVQAFLPKCSRGSHPTTYNSSSTSPRYGTMEIPNFLFTKRAILVKLALIPCGNFVKPLLNANSEISPQP